MKFNLIDPHSVARLFVGAVDRCASAMLLALSVAIFATPTFAAAPPGTQWTVTATAGTGGSISPSGATKVFDGESLVLTVTPNAGYNISNVSGCQGSRVGNTYTTGAITANCTVSATFVRSSFTVTPTAGAHGTISPSTPQTVSNGGRISFTLTPALLYQIGTVTGCGGSLTGNSYTTGTITADCTVSATFTQPTTAVAYTMSTAISGVATGGTITPSSRQVLEGTTTTFIATPNSGYAVTGVTGCGTSFVPGALPQSTALTVTTEAAFRDCTVIVTFSLIPSFTVTATADVGGTVSPTSVSVRQGNTTTITVTPNVGFRLTNVNGCGVVFFGAANIITPTTWTTAPITGACTVSAFFAAVPTFNVSTSAGAGGSISPTSKTVSQGGVAQFTISANSGFEIATVSGCSGSLAGSVYTTGVINAACAVSAAFNATAVAPTTVSMVEFYHPPLNYYFLTSRANEIALLDATPPFTRTGQSFQVYRSSIVGTQPITRFYFDRVAVNETRGSHFYTALTGEVTALHSLNPSNSSAARLAFDEGVDSYAFLPVVEGVGGSCAAGQTPVFRLFRGNQRFPDDPNHRFTTSTSVYNSFVAQGWDGEGVKLCAPQ